MLFYTGKAYVKQLRERETEIQEIKPVYGLSLAHDIFHTPNELENTCYHHYPIVNTEQNNDEHIEGMELIFIGLLKLSPL